MAIRKYDWDAAASALKDAQFAVFDARRHMTHRKRANVLKDIVAAEHALASAYEALESPSAREK